MCWPEQPSWCGHCQQPLMLGTQVSLYWGCAPCRGTRALLAVNSTALLLSGVPPLQSSCPGPPAPLACRARPPGSRSPRLIRCSSPVHAGSGALAAHVPSRLHPRPHQLFANVFPHPGAVVLPSFGVSGLSSDENCLPWFFVFTPRGAQLGVLPP